MDRTYRMSHVTGYQETIAEDLSVVSRDKAVDAGHLLHERRQKIALRALVGYRADFLLKHGKVSAEEVMPSGQHGKKPYVVEKHNGAEMFLVIRACGELFLAYRFNQSVDGTEAGVIGKSGR